MRSCIYCGRELKDGEKCNCPRAVARRAAKETHGAERPAGNTETNNDGGYYRTGYTNNDGRIKHAWERFKTKLMMRRRARGSGGVKGGGRDIFSYIVRFIKAPAEEISNPKNFSMPQMLLAAAVQGAIIGLCLYFVATGASRSWFRALANILGLGGIGGYRMIMFAGMYMVSGAIGGIIFFYIHSGIFWIINKLLFRSRTEFKLFAQRLVLTNVPFTALAAIGVLFAVFSTTSLVILLLCGALSSFLMTYISLCGEWSSFSESRVMYAMILGYFVLFAFICSILRMSPIIGG